MIASTELRAVGVSSFKNLGALRSHLWERGVLEDRTSQIILGLRETAVAFSLKDRACNKSHRSKGASFPNRRGRRKLVNDAFHVSFRYT